MSRWIRSSWSLMILAAAAFPLQAAEEPSRPAAVAEKAFEHADLQINAERQEVSELPAGEMATTRGRLQRLAISEAPSRLDARSGRFATLLPTEPLVPGGGVGNSLTWDAVAGKVPADRSEREAAAWNAFHSYLADHASDLGVKLEELSPDYRIASHPSEIYQIHVPRTFDGIPVRGVAISAFINRGNLVLMGFDKWGDFTPAATGGQLTSEEATQAARNYLAPLQVSGAWAKTELLYVPMADHTTPASRYDYRLVWAVNSTLVEDPGGHWETLVDARSGEVLAHVDQNHYADVKGGVFPVSNDGNGADGMEQDGYPMPFMTVGGSTTDTGGNVPLFGSLTGTLSGPYVKISDNCGAVSLTQNDMLDFGSSAGTDCTTPGFGGAGNTHASRTGFYELNKIIEMGRGQLPANVWLTQQLTSNMNINQTCNAFWGGGSVNFYRSGGGCANTGEIAGVFDHEWGHGLDDNDVEGSVTGPSGEGIADIYTALRLNTSCIGRGFRATPCTGFGDACLTCTGVRDIDYLQRVSGNPHDYTWSNANCSGSTHCVGSVYSEAVWSLWKRLLQTAPYSYDNNTAQEIVSRLTFIGAGSVSTWFSGGPPNGGCAASGGYMNYLAADDDNGDLNDGTPHMNAIYTAFNDQQIACATPAVQESGCAATPAQAPVVTTGNGNQLVTLSWGSVPDATAYQVYRTEGIAACDFGKVKLGETAGLTWDDNGLQNGRDYSYVVIPIGASSACMGPASACATDAPVGQPDFFLSCTPSSLLVEQGTTVDITCTGISSFGYTGSVDLSCSGNPAGIGCAFSTTTLVLPADGTMDSTLTLTVDAGQTVDAYTFDVVGNDGATNRVAPITVQVTPIGQNGPQDAAYDAGLGAPQCSTSGNSCDSLGLLDGRGNLGPEVNQPNTTDSCTDGGSGTYHSDESNDRLVVRTLDYFDFAPGATVQVEATVYAWSTGSSDHLDLYYAADATNPVWIPLGTQQPPSGGVQTLTAQYVLPEGGLQAVRANFRYTGSQSSCSAGNYDDADDLVFAVGSGQPPFFTDGFESGDLTGWSSATGN